MPESDRRRAVPRVKLGCFNCLSDHRGEGEVEHFQIHTIFILFSAPLTPVWKELAVSLQAKGRFFSFLFFFLHHSYPEQEAYRTKDHQRLQEPEQRSAVLKKRKGKGTVLKLNLASQPYTESFQDCKRLEQCGWIHSFCQVVKVMTVQHLFSTHGRN